MRHGIGLVVTTATLAIAGGCSLPLLPEVADPCATWQAPGFYRMQVDGFDRKTLVEVPGTEGPRPLVVALHGYGGSAAEFATEVTRYAEEGRDRGYVVAFPQGSGVPGGAGWNAGTCCGTSELGADDVGFLEAVTAALADRVCTAEVLATGHSNGSMMANRWACASDTPDAVVGSSGPLLLEACAGDPVPVVQVVGTADTVVPPEGGGGSIGQEPFPAADDAFALWEARNGCTGDVSRSDEDGVEILQRSCDTMTALITLDGWKHAFPGGKRNRPAAFDLETAALDVLEMVVALRTPEGPQQDTDAPVDTGPGVDTD